jgi:hypothetical protein
MNAPLGRTGIVVLVIASVLLLGEDLLILYNTGVLPAIEFLLLDIVVIGILAIAIREARRRIPP